MAYVWQRWMPAELRAAGLNVVEVDGWQNRGRPASTGHFQPRGLNVTHHTGATSSPQNPSAGLATLINGRSDLPGPLCQTAIGYDGTVYVVAAGRANVNGRKRAVPNWPETDGNEQMGCEVITNGTQAMPEAQIRAITVHNAVMLRHFGRSPDGYLYRHQDISLSGKWDLGSRSTAQLRADVHAAADPTKPPPLSPEEDLMLPYLIRNANGAVVVVHGDGARVVSGTGSLGVLEALGLRYGPSADPVVQARFRAMDEGPFSLYIEMVGGLKPRGPGA